MKNQALSQFDQQLKIGSNEVSKTYRDKLEVNIEAFYAPIKAQIYDLFNRPPPPTPRPDSPSIIDEIINTIVNPIDSIRDVFGW